MMVVIPNVRKSLLSRFYAKKFSLGPIHTKDARFFGCGNSAADISKPHTFKWDHVGGRRFGGSVKFADGKNAKRRGQISCLT